jgi:hypothetical protein
MGTVEKKYFTCWFRLQQRDLFLIWILAEPELVLIDEQGYIPIFSSELALATYARNRGLDIINETPLLHNLDAIEEWLQHSESYIDCDIFQGAWNLFTDVAHALQLSFRGDKHGRLRNRIYDKLYFGNNLFIGDPILGHPSGKFYIPQWSLKEKTKLAQVLSHGLAIFKSNLREIKE